MVCTILPILIKQYPHLRQTVTKTVSLGGLVIAPRCVCASGVK